MRYKVLVYAASLYMPPPAGAFAGVKGTLSSAAGLADEFSLLVLPLIVKTSFIFMSVITVLVVCLMFIKMTATIWESDIRRAKRWMLPILERYLTNGSAGIPRRFRNTRWPLRRVLQYVIVYRSFGETGGRLADIAALYERLGFVDSDLRRLGSRFWWVRAEAARCLGQMKAARAKKALLSMLDDGMTEARLMAAWALGRIGEPDAIGPILGSLVKTSKLAGMRLSSTVFEWGNKAVEPLLGALSHEDPAVKTLALHLLGELNDKTALPHIRNKAAPGEDLEVRLAAYKALGTISDGSSRGFLLESLSDPFWQVRAQAARALGDIGGREAVERLRRALEDPKWWVRRNAGEALIRTGEEGRKAMLDVLRLSPSSPAGRMAAQWLDEYGYLP